MTAPTDDDRRARWQLLDRALDELMDLSPQSWPAAIDRLAAGDALLRHELDALCHALDGHDPVLDRPAAALAGLATDDAGLAAGSLLGPWRVLALIGRGGMGEVYRAERADGQYEQIVALKLVQRGTADQVQRFHVERQTLARLDHPGIARLLDGGVLVDGRPYMVIEFVEGGGLTDWCRERQSGLDERLRLFKQVCDAVAYAHSHQVVHRDIKPGNVLVSPDGTVKLLDFGIAKLLQAPDAAVTQTQDLPFTPGYAAPEQMSGGQVTTAADVYSLGMLLFELLAGEPPWPAAQQPLAMLIQRVQDGVIPVLSQHAARSTCFAVAPTQLAGDLDAIVAKATRAAPQDRYETVAALRSDLDHHLKHEPVVAREGARLYELGLLLSRHRALAISAVAVLAVVLVGTATTLWQARVARVEAAKAAAERDFVVSIFRQNGIDQPDGVKARHTTAEQLLDLGAKRIRTELRGQPEVRAEMLDTLSDLYFQLQKFDKVIELESERLAELRDRDAGHPSQEQADTLYSLGEAYYMTGGYANASDSLRAALTALDSLGDSHSAERGEVLLELGRVAYRRQTAAGDREAEDRAREAHEILLQHDDGNYLFASQLQARVVERQGRAREALAQYRAIVVEAGRPLFQDHPSMAALCDHDLGDALMHLHRYREAEQTLRKALATFIALGGDDYPDANATRSTLGATLVQRARGAEGLQLLQQALASLERTQGPNIIAWTVPARNRAAAAALDRGALDLAQGWLERQPQSVSLAAPEDVAQQPLTLLLDARLQLARGQVALAQTAFDRARLGWPESTAKHTPHRAVLLLVQAQLDLAQGRHEAGLRLLDEIRAEWSGQGEDLSEPAVVASLLLAQAWLDQGSAAPAAALMRSLLDRVLDDPDHDDLSDWEARTRRLLGDALLALGQVDAARPHLERAVALRQGFDDPASPWLAQARASLARSQSGLHRRPQAGATVNPRKT